MAACSADDAETARSTSTTLAPMSSSSTAAMAADCHPPERAVHDERVQQVVDVFLFCGPGMATDLDLRAVARVVPSDPAPLEAAITQLLIGATPDETAAGLASGFSAHTAGTLRSASVVDGIAVLDFTTGFVHTNNFSTSNLSAVVMRQIEATVFEFAEVDGLEFRVDGERWCGWENICDAAPYPLRRRPG